MAKEQDLVVAPAPDGAETLHLASPPPASLPPADATKEETVRFKVKDASLKKNDSAQSVTGEAGNANHELNHVSNDAATGPQSPKPKAGEDKQMSRARTQRIMTA